MTRFHDIVKLVNMQFNERALTETQTLRAAYAGGVRPPSNLKRIALFVQKVIRGSRN